jgi:sodium/potassium-transporting ATPase subunit alpha
MTVSECSIEGGDISVDTAVKQLALNASPANASIVTTAVGQLRSMAALCNAAEFDAADSEKPLANRTIFGDATDQAVLRFAERLDEGCVAYLKACWHKLFEIPFNSKNKFMIRCFNLSRREALGQVLPEGYVDTFQVDDMSVSNRTGRVVSCQ